MVAEDEIHSSVFLKTNPPPVTRCTVCCARFHCPLCPASLYKSQAKFKVLQHLEVHKKNALQHEDFYITKCHQACRTGTSGHFHCAFCSKTVIRREDAQRHLETCRTLSVSQVEERPRKNKKLSDPIPGGQDDASDDRSGQEDDRSGQEVASDNCSGQEDDCSGQEDCSPGLALDNPPPIVQRAKSRTHSSICQYCNVEMLTKNMKLHIYRKHTDTAVRDINAVCNGRPASVPPSASQAVGPPSDQIPVQPSTKRPKRRTEQQQQEMNGHHKGLLEAAHKKLDEDEYFFLSLVPACKRMAPRKKAQLKLNIMQMVAQAEFDTDDE